MDFTIGSALVERSKNQMETQNLSALYEELKKKVAEGKELKKNAES